MVRDVRDSAAYSPQGALVLVVGPSGAGKDTLIAHARDRLVEDKRFVFVQRIITRPSEPLTSGGEVHEAMTEKQFLDARARGELAFSWHSHGLHYGIQNTIVEYIADGRVVVANVSRTVIPAAGEIAARRLVVNVTARPEFLAARLEMRGRETNEQIASRVTRSVDIELAGAAFAEIRNEGSVVAAGSMLLDLLLPLAHSRRH